jgi:hypothetical protein
MGDKPLKLILKIIPIAATAVLLFVACPNQPSENFQPELNVFGVLRSDYSGLKIQKINIDRTYAMDDTVEYDLQNALAVIFDDSLCDTLLQYFDYIWWGFEHPVLPGQTYRIMVCADGLDTLQGETTVPGAFTFIFPQPGDTVFPDDTILIKKSSGGKVYEIHLFQDDTLSSMFMSFPDFLPDSLFRFPVSELYLGEGDWRLEIAAYDSNFFNYQYSSEEYPQCGVQGGLGAFCSAYVNSVEFYFQYQP